MYSLLCLVVSIMCFKSSTGEILCSNTNKINCVVYFYLYCFDKLEP